MLAVMSLVVFKVHLDPNRAEGELLSEQMLSETQAQVMTTDEAIAVGFSGVKPDPNLRLVAVARRDRGFVQQALERHVAVVGFSAHDVD